MILEPTSCIGLLLDLARNLEFVPGGLWMAPRKIMEPLFFFFFPLLFFSLHLFSFTRRSKHVWSCEETAKDVQCWHLFLHTEKPTLVLPLIINYNISQQRGNILKTIFCLCHSTFSFLFWLLGLFLFFMTIFGPRYSPIKCVNLSFRNNLILGNVLWHHSWLFNVPGQPMEQLWHLKNLQVVNYCVSRFLHECNLYKISHTIKKAENLFSN